MLAFKVKIRSSQAYKSALSIESLYVNRIIVENKLEQGYGKSCNDLLW